MLRSKLLFFFLLFVSIMKVEAQTNFLKGYYITSSQDTIHGYIDYRSERRNYSLCIYRESLNSKSVNLYPKDIIGFTVDNKDFYETHSFKSKKGEELYGFFKVLVRGKLSLLRYVSRYFVKEANNKVSEISKTSEITEERKLKEDYAGLGLLIFLMNDCEETSRTYLEKKYTSNIDYIEIFKKYNQCVGGQFQTTQKIVIHPHFDFGLQASPTFNGFKFNTSAENVTFDNQLSASGGGFVSIFLPKVNERVRLVAEVTYNRYNGYAYFSFDNSNNDLFIDYSSLKFPLLVRLGQTKFFFDIGIQNQFILDQHLKWRIETLGQNTVNTTEGDVPPLNKWSYGYLVGMGLNYKLANHAVRSSLRFSHIRESDHPNNPVYQTIEFIFAFQLTR